MGSAGLHCTKSLGALYTNLDPGHYKFQVTAANESGIWNESGAVIEIVIPPTFIQTKTFALLCIAVALILLWFAYALRVRRLTASLRNRLEERVAERERIARDLHDTLLQGVQGLILKFHDVTEERWLAESSRCDLRRHRADAAWVSDVTYESLSTNLGVYDEATTFALFRQSLTPEQVAVWTNFVKGAVGLSENVCKSGTVFSRFQ